MAHRAAPRRKPQPPSLLRQSLCVAFTAFVIAGSDVAVTLGAPIRDPGGIYFLAVLLATLVGGIWAGLASAAVVVGFLAAADFLPGVAMSTVAWEDRHILGHIVLLSLVALVFGAIQMAMRSMASKAFESQTEALSASEQARRTARELETSERMRELVVESSLDAIIAMREDGTVTLWNPESEAMFGWSAEEALGQPLCDLIIPERLRAAHREGLARYLESGDGPILNERIETTARRKDGSEYDVELSVVAHRWAKGATFVGFVRDIEHRKAAEAAIHELNSTLEQRVAERTAELSTVNHELEAFCHSVSHDLRSPLRSIDGFSHILLEDYGDKLDEEGREHLGKVRAASQRMAQLIDDLLNLSRVSRSEMKRERVSLTHLVHTIAGDLKKQHPSRKVKWIVGQGLYAFGDRRLLRVALSNILENAFKFTSKRGAQATIEFGAVNRDLDPIFYVRDNGAGFDMAHKDKLFGTFQRLHGVHEFEGTGVGLATVHRIIEKHGGSIWAEAAVGKGATFYFTLPGKAEPEEERSASSEDEEEAPTV